MSEQIEIVKKFIGMVEGLTFDADRTSQLLHPDYMQWEFPNLLNRSGQKSDLSDSVKRMSIAKKILNAQTYKISSIIEQASTVVVEAIWSGQIAVGAGSFKSGQTLSAFFCMVFEFKEGKIHRVRNYDCFEDFGNSNEVP